MQDVAALEISLVADVVVTPRDQRQLAAQQCVGFARGPDEKLAFLALAVRILGGIEAVFRTGHLAQNVVENFTRNIQKFRLVQRAPRVKVEPREQGVVVKHLFKMRNQPSFIDAIAMKSAADLIADTALGHFGQSVTDHMRVVGIVLGVVGPQKKRKHEGVGKLRRLTEPAVNTIVRAGKFVRRDDRQVALNLAVSRRVSAERVKRRGQLFDVMPNLVRIAAKGVRDRHKYPRKPRHALAVDRAENRFRRKTVSPPA